MNYQNSRFSLKKLLFMGIVCNFAAIFSSDGLMTNILILSDEKYSCEFHNTGSATEIQVFRGSWLIKSPVLDVRNNTFKTSTCSSRERWK